MKAKIKNWISEWVEFFLIQAEIEVRTRHCYWM